MFLALLLNSFSSDSLQTGNSKGEEEPNKIAEAFDRMTRFYNFVTSKCRQCLHLPIKKAQQRDAVVTFGDEETPEIAAVNGKDKVDGDVRMRNGTIGDSSGTDDVEKVITDDKTGKKYQYFDVKLKSSYKTLLCHFIHKGYIFFHCHGHCYFCY